MSTSTPFQREERYIVIKRKHLNMVQEAAIRGYLEGSSLNTVECVVVEHDWPEYEAVWKMIERRVTGDQTQTDHLADDAIREISARFPEWEPSPAMIGFARAVVTAATQPLIEVERDADGNVLSCTGCGTVETVRSIRARSATAFTCCPERKMVSIHRREQQAAEAIREKCATKATSFLIGDPKKGIPLRSPSPHEIADAIRSIAVPYA